MRGLGAILLILLGHDQYVSGRVHLVDRAFRNIPLDADEEDQLVLSWDVGLAALASETAKTDLLALGIAVLLDVGLGTLEDDTTLLLVGLGCTVSMIRTARYKILMQEIYWLSVPKDG